MISFACPHCDKKLRVKEELAGKKARCPQCGQLVPIPSPAAPRTPPDPRPNLPATEQRTLPPLTQAAPLEAETLAPFFGQALPSETMPTLAPADAGMQAPTGDYLPHGAIQVPGYKILSELGRGGMGVVYMARHLQLNRVVALKMVLAGGHAGTAERARFLAEAEAVASLQHVNIVQVFDFGQHGELPYMALEFINGGSLHSRLGEGLPRPREAAWLVEQLARGVAVAHAKGIVHRDLKPHNVLLAVPEGNDPAQTPLGQCTPKVTDFGLAKKVEAESGMTQTGAIMGTPSYMPPEQAQGDRKVGPAADVYALGAILYECLTGRPPFRGPTAMETIMQVVMDEPVPPSQLQAKLPKDVETICLKCLQKVPEKRYATALELAEDLRRYQGGEPIKARPVGAVERGVRWVRRNPVVAGLSAGLVLALTSGLVASILFALNARSEAARADEQTVEAKEKARAAEEAEGKARDAEGKEREAKGVAEREARAAREAEGKTREAKEEAEREARAARQREYDANMLLAQNAWGQHSVYRVLDVLESHGPRPGQEDLRGFEWHYWKKLMHLGHQDLQRGPPVFSVAFSRDGRRLAWASEDRTIKVWDMTAGREALSLKAANTVLSLAFSPDNKRLATVDFNGAAKVLDLSTGAEAFPLRGHTANVLAVAFSPDGKRLASASADQTVKVWDAATGRETFTYKGHKSRVTSVAFSPDSKTVASGSMEKENDERGGFTGAVRLWDAVNGRETLTLLGYNGDMRSIAFSPDGKQVAAASSAGQDAGIVKVNDVITGKEAILLQGNLGATTSLSYSGDGKRLVAGGLEGVVRVWDTSTGGEVLTLQGHRSSVRSVAFGPDGKQLASGSDDGTVKLWDAVKGQEPLTLGDITPLQSRPIGGGSLIFLNPAFARDGKHLAAGDRDGRVRVWDTSTGQEAFTIKGHTGQVSGLAFSPDSKWLASRSWDGTAKLWEASSGKEVLTLKGHGGTPGGLAFSSNSRRLAVGSQTGMAHIWDPVSGQEVLTLNSQEARNGTGLGVAFSPDDRLAVGGMDGTVQIWNATSGQKVLTFKTWPNPQPVFTLTFSPDGKRLASGNIYDGTAKLWDAATGEPLLTLRGHTAYISGVAFSPDGKRLATASADRTVKVWDTATGGETLTLRWHTPQITGVAFSPDGKRLAAASVDMTVRVWDADSGE